MQDLERLIEIADAAGVEIRTVNGGDLDLSNATGKMLARILGSVPEWSPSTRPNVNAAPTSSAPRPALVVVATVFRLHPARRHRAREAALIRRAAADVLDGKSLRAVARAWNAVGRALRRAAPHGTPRGSSGCCSTPATPGCAPTTARSPAPALAGDPRPRHPRRSDRGAARRPPAGGRCPTSGNTLARTVTCAGCAGRCCNTPSPPTPTGAPSTATPAPPPRTCPAPSPNSTPTWKRSYWPT